VPVALSVALSREVASLVNDVLLATRGLGDAVPTVLGPAVEEIAKASALLVVLAVWRSEIDDPLDGIVYGALAGLGFGPPRLCCLGSRRRFVLGLVLRAELRCEQGGDGDRNRRSSRTHN